MSNDITPIIQQAFEKKIYWTKIQLHDIALFLEERSGYRLNWEEGENWYSYIDRGTFHGFLGVDIPLLVMTPMFQSLIPSLDSLGVSYLIVDDLYASEYSIDKEVMKDIFDIEFSGNDFDYDKICLQDFWWATIT